MARVLVTGGAGFIGSHLSEALVERGDQVRVLDNFSSGDPKNLEGIQSNIELMRGDLREPADVQKAVAHTDLIFHQAAFVSLPKSLETPAECYAVNITGTINLLEAARRAGAGRVVLASSAAVYGPPTELPQRESAQAVCASPYAASKLFNETLAKLYSLTYQLPVVALRYFNVYGPRQSPESQYAAVVPKFIQRLKTGLAPLVQGDGLQTRDFIFVGDAVRANLLAAEAEGVGGGVFNVCSGAETNLLDLLEVLYRLFPNAPRLEFSAPRPGDVARSLGDPGLAAKALNFRAKTSLSDGLTKTVAGWLA